MAIDTAAKRKSAIGIAVLSLRLGVIPDAANLDAPQRLHVQGLYSGIAASPTIAAAAIGELRTEADPIRYLGGTAAFSTLGGSLAGANVLGGSLSTDVIGGSLS